MTTEPPPPRSLQPSARVAGLGTALAVTMLVTAVSAGAALLLAGRAELYGALLGAALVCGFFLFGTLSTNLVAAYAPGLALFVALLTYTLQVLLLGVALVALTRSGATERTVDVRWLAGVVIAGTLAWTTALVVHAVCSVRAAEPRTAGDGRVGPAAPRPARGGRP